MFLKRLSLFCLSAFFATLAQAQNYPSQPISIVIGFSPGGSIDILARLIAPKLSELLKVPVYVDTKAGANGNIGLQYVARAKPDGYTIYLGSTGPLILNPLINKSIKFSIDTDVMAVNTVAKTMQVVATGSRSKFKTFKELIDSAKSKSQPINIGTSGIAGNSHLLLEAINVAAGSALLHVPYKGAGPAIVDAMSNQIDGIVSDYPGVLAIKEGGALTVLAVAESQRSRLLPNVPTINEALKLGTDIDLSQWFAFIVPKDTPEEIRKTLFGALANAAADKEVQERMASAGYVSFTQKSFGSIDQFIAAENAKWKTLVNNPDVQRKLQN